MFKFVNQRTFDFRQSVVVEWEQIYAAGCPWNVDDLSKKQIFIIRIIQYQNHTQIFHKN